MKQPVVRTAALGAALLLGLVVASPVRAGLAIVPLYNANVPAAAEAAFDYAIIEFESRFSNNMTMVLDVQFGNTGLGSSNSTVVGSFQYSNIRGALQAQALANPGDSIKQTVVANLPANNPAPVDRYWITTANAKALGLSNYAGPDGTITFSNSVQYTYDPSVRGVTGKYDFIGVAEHEISEVMGRIPGLGSNYGPGPSYDVNDLYRFTNGARNFTVNQSDPPGVYFSIDGGATNLTNFYSQGADNDDYRGDNPTDPFNQFTGTNQAHALNSVDITNLDAIGYNVYVAAPTPEPASLVLFGLGGVGLAGIRAWQRRRRLLEAIA